MNRQACARNQFETYCPDQMPRNGGHPSRVSTWPVLLFALVGLLPLGCQPQAPVSKNPVQKGLGADPAQVAAKTAASSPHTELLAWPKPAAALLLTSDMKGYLEPCGCSLTQSGGLGRRSEFFQQLRGLGWPVSALDAGGTLKRARRQDQLKFEALLGALQQLGYSALALGSPELQLGPDLLLQHQVVEPEPGTDPVTLLGCNVVLLESPDLGTPQHWKLLKVGAVEIGVTAVVGESQRETVAPAGLTDSVSLLPPSEALPPVIAELKAKGAQVLVLLSHGTLEEARELAEKHPEFQLVVTANGHEDPDGKAIKVGSSLVLETGGKGKYVGVLWYYPDSAEEPFRYTTIDLKSTVFQGDRGMDAVMASYQARLQEEQLAISPAIEIPHSSGRTYVGAAKCGECHKQAYNKWKGTKHGHAYESLERGRKGQERDWVSRVFDPECLACHVAGWNPQEVLRYTSGFRSMEETPHLAGQQCENCHNPGSEHTSLEEAFRLDAKSVTREALVEGRKQVKLFSAEAEKKVCINCHDGENSPNWNFAKYWAEVVHPWKD